MGLEVVEVGFLDGYVDLWCGGVLLLCYCSECCILVLLCFLIID